MNYSVQNIKALHLGFIQVELCTVQHEKFDGSMTDMLEREVVIKDTAVASIVYHRQKEEFIFVRQFRTAVTDTDDPWMIEVVAGHIDADESAETAIKREILEEIGYEVINVKEKGTFFTSPGYSNEQIKLFYCEVTEENHISAGGGEASESEDIQLVSLTEKEISNALKRKKFRDAKTIIGIQNYLMQKYGIL